MTGSTLDINRPPFWAEHVSKALKDCKPLQVFRGGSPAASEGDRLTYGIRLIAVKDDLGIVTASPSLLRQQMRDLFTRAIDKEET
jgi:hypothetical protein